MNTPTSYRTSALPDLSGRGAAAAKTLIVAGPLALLGSQVAANLQSTSGEVALSRVAVPLMLAWAAVLFLITRATAPVAAWTGLVAVTLQVTLVQEVTEGWVLLTIESVGFIAFAVGLARVWWVPRIVPVLLVALPVLDALAPQRASLVTLVSFAGVVAVGLVLAVRMRWAGSEAPATRLDERPWPGAQRPRVTVASVGRESAPRVRMPPPLG